jgi:hypothetical protein
MKFIKLTNTKGDQIVLNVAHIGHLYPVEVTVGVGINAKRTIHTNVGVTTHNNGGFRVTETVDEIMELINKM